MTREEVIEIVKSLRVEVKEATEYGYGGDLDKTVEVKLVLALEGEPKEVLSEDYFYLEKA
ncbi:MAG: hypothetical protein GF334_05775 [Candidatus Altiarchaeales archaeon]|nr:hypothetical protein [Candidatus Altiarchaeales archaeon]